MKIVFYTPGSIEFSDYKSGNLLGTEYQVFGLASELAKRNYDVYVFRRWYHESMESINDFNIVNIYSPEVPDAVAQKVLTKLLYSRQLMKFSKILNPDIMILTDVFSSLYLTKLNTSKVFVTHNPPADLSPNKLFLKKYLLKIAEKKVFDKTNILIALNSAIKEYLTNKNYNAVLISNGVQISLYRPSFTSDAHYVLFGGRLVKIKGLHYLLIAYSKISERLQRTYSLVIVGYGPEERTLKKLSLKLGLKDKVRFIPWLSKNEFIKVIQNASVVVLPSLSEVSNVFILESMACGKPVIASKILATQDVITHMYDGVLFEKGNVSSLKKSLEMMLENPDIRLKLGRNARKTIENKYSFEIIANNYVKVFESI